MTNMEALSTEGEEVPVVENVSTGEVVEQVDAVQSSSSTEPPTLESQKHQSPPEISETQPSIQQENLVEKEEDDDDDDFGDFGDVSTTHLPLPPPVTVVPMPPALPELHPIHVPESVQQAQAFIDSFVRQRYSLMVCT